MFICLFCVIILVGLRKEKRKKGKREIYEKIRGLFIYEKKSLYAKIPHYIGKSDVNIYF